MTTTLTFILPDMFNGACYQAADKEIKQSISKFFDILRRSKLKTIPSFEDWLSKELSITKLPFNSAKTMAQGEGIVLDKDTKCLRADPVLFTATHNGLYCSGNRVLGINEAEKNELQSLINDYLQEDNMQFILTQGYRGYLTYRTEPDAQFTPLSSVFGQEISVFLPKGNNASFWHRLMTDVQMLLHNSSVNIVRQARGEQPVSGLWLWGEKDDYCQTIESEHTLFTDNPVVAALHNQTCNLDSIANINFHSLDFSKNIVIYISDFALSNEQNDVEQWNSLFKQWINRWILPAMDAVKKGEVTSVKLCFDNNRVYTFDKSARWAFWRHHKFSELRNNL